MQRSRAGGETSGRRPLGKRRSARCRSTVGERRLYAAHNSASAGDPVLLADSALATARKQGRGLGTLQPTTADGPSRLAIREREGAGVRGQETSRGIDAGRWGGLPHRAGVPVPDEKQGRRTDHDDGAHAVGVVRPAGGELGGARRFVGRDSLTAATRGITSPGAVAACVRLEPRGPRCQCSPRRLVRAGSSSVAGSAKGRESARWRCEAGRASPPGFHPACWWRGVPGSRLRCSWRVLTSTRA